MRGTTATDLKLIALDTVDSTMLEAERQIGAGRAMPFLVWARSQSGGAGRHGRVWWSPPDNLYWTIALERDRRWGRDVGLTFAAGLAVADALVGMGTPASRVAIKWPNDVLLDGRKVAGVLIRATDVPGTSDVGVIIVGIGVNVLSFPADAVFPAISLAAAGIEADLVALRDAVTARFVDRLGDWAEHGLAGLRPELERRLFGIGQTVRVALDAARTVIVEGVNAGLDAQGGLRLMTADGGSRVITAGDVL